MRTAIAFLGFLALTSCDPPSGADGYVFEHKEWVALSARINFVLHRNVEELRRDAPPEALRPGEDLQAWSRVSQGHCEIHIVDPGNDYYPQWIGHEVTHCLFGRWHVSR